LHKIKVVKINYANRKRKTSLKFGENLFTTSKKEIATRTAYFRRKDSAFLAYAHSLAELDVTLNRSTLKRKDQYVYSYTRLAIILDKKKLFKEALAIVDEALQLNLNDKTVQGYQGRKTRILDKMRKVA
jgi:hypothetical protein